MLVGNFQQNAQLQTSRGQTSDGQRISQQPVKAVTDNDWQRISQQLVKVFGD